METMLREGTINASSTSYEELERGFFLGKTTEQKEKECVRLNSLQLKVMATFALYCAVAALFIIKRNEISSMAGEITTCSLVAAGLPLSLAACKVDRPFKKEQATKVALGVLVPGAIGLTVGLLSGKEMIQHNHLARIKMASLGIGSLILSCCIDNYEGWKRRFSEYRIHCYCSCHPTSEQAQSQQ